eukprot:1712723-Amphidinium_carterae.1
MKLSLKPFVARSNKNYVHAIASSLNANETAVKSITQAGLLLLLLLSPLGGVGFSRGRPLGRRHPSWTPPIHAVAQPALMIEVSLEHCP